MAQVKTSISEGMIVDQETLNHLPAFHKAIAEVLIEKGRWQLAEATR